MMIEFSTDKEKSALKKAFLKSNKEQITKGRYRIWLKALFESADITHQRYDEIMGNDYNGVLCNVLSKRKELSTRNGIIIATLCNMSRTDKLKLLNAIDTKGWNHE